MSARLVMPPDEHAALARIWHALNAAGHGDCGGYSHSTSGGGILCACGAVIEAIPVYPDRRAS